MESVNRYWTVSAVIMLLNCAGISRLPRIWPTLPASPTTFWQLLTVANWKGRAGTLCGICPSARFPPHERRTRWVFTAIVSVDGVLWMPQKENALVRWNAMRTLSRKSKTAFPSQKPEETWLNSLLTLIPGRTSLSAVLEGLFRNSAVYTRCRMPRHCALSGAVPFSWGF